MGRKRTAREKMIATQRFPLGKGVYGRFLRGANGRIELAVIVGEQTRAEDLRTAWGEIDRARERLREFQGDNPNAVMTALRLNKARMHFLEGYSYAEIAMDMNYDCLVNLCSAAIELEKGLTLDAIQSMRNVRHLLKAVRMKDNAITDWITNGLTEIKRGYAPWTLTRGPVDKQRVRNALRQLKREVESKRLIIKSTQKAVLVPLSEVGQRGEAARRRAKELLRREPNSGGLDRMMQVHIERLREGVHAPIIIT